MCLFYQVCNWSELLRLNIYVKYAALKNQKDIKMDWTSVIFAFIVIGSTGVFIADSYHECKYKGQ